MKEVLKLIVETDKASREEVQKAIDEREALNDSLSDIKDKIYSKYEDSANAKIEKEKAVAQAQTDEAQKRIKETVEKKKAELNALYEKEHKAWEKHIVEAVIS